MKNIENWIEAFREADGPPPKTLWAFVSWCLASSWPVLILAALLSAGAGAMEAGTAYILGLVIDAVVGSGADNFYTPANIMMVVLAVGFFVVIRPLMFALSSGANHIIVMPNVSTLVQSRLHRWSLGQSVTFFDDDFAGRIAQKQMQTARAVCICFCAIRPSMWSRLHWRLCWAALRCLVQLIGVLQVCL